MRDYPCTEQCISQRRCHENFGRSPAHFARLPRTQPERDPAIPQDSGFHIVAATEKGDYDYTKADYTGPMCIIMGAEDKGVSYDNLALCDEWVKIPMLGTIESLNVSVAAGILIYEAVKQRTN